MINHTSRNTADLENSPLLRSVGEGPCWGQPPEMRFVVHGCHHRAQPASPERCSTRRARPFPGACRDFSLHPISTDGLRTGQTSRHHRGTSAPRANSFSIRHTEQTASNVPKRCPSARKAKPRATNHQPSVPCFFSPPPTPLLPFPMGRGELQAVHARAACLHEAAAAAAALPSQWRELEWNNLPAAGTQAAAAADVPGRDSS